MDSTEAITAAINERLCRRRGGFVAFFHRNWPYFFFFQLCINAAAFAIVLNKL